MTTTATIGTNELPASIEEELGRIGNWLSSNFYRRYDIDGDGNVDLAPAYAGKDVIASLVARIDEVDADEKVLDQAWGYTKNLIATLHDHRGYLMTDEHPELLFELIASCKAIESHQGENSEWLDAVEEETRFERGETPDPRENRPSSAEEYDFVTTHSVRYITAITEQFQQERKWSGGNTKHESMGDHIFNIGVMVEELMKSPLVTPDDENARNIVAAWDAYLTALKPYWRRLRKTTPKHWERAVDTIRPLATLIGYDITHLAGFNARKKPLSD